MPPAKTAPPDSLLLLAAATKDQPAVIRIVSDGKPDLYFAAELACDVPDCRNFDVVGFRAKLRGHEEAVKRYNVLVEAPMRDRPARGSCECPGGTYRPDRGPCRHLRFLSALWSRGLI